MSSSILYSSNKRRSISTKPNERSVWCPVWDGIFHRMSCLISLSAILELLSYSSSSRQSLPWCTPLILRIAASQVFGRYHILKDRQTIWTFSQRKHCPVQGPLSTASSNWMGLAGQPASSLLRRMLRSHRSLASTMASRHWQISPSQRLGKFRSLIMQLCRASNSKYLELMCSNQ